MIDADWLKCCHVTVFPTTQMTFTLFLVWCQVGDETVPRFVLRYLERKIRLSSHASLNANETVTKCRIEWDTKQSLLHGHVITTSGREIPFTAHTECLTLDARNHLAVINSLCDCIFLASQKPHQNSGLSARCSRRAL
jgi:hypothetical protein